MGLEATQQIVEGNSHQLVIRTPKESYGESQGTVRWKDALKP